MHQTSEWLYREDATEKHCSLYGSGDTYLCTHIFPFSLRGIWDSEGHRNGMILPCRNPVHLYRSLLREASYLFDPAAQTFHTEHIRWSFQRQRAKQSSLHVQTQDGLSARLSQHDSKQLKRARQYLYMLERANKGYMTAVKNVLRMTYARKGKQKRLLVKDIMTPPSANDPTVVAAPTMHDQNWRPPAKFSALLGNQNIVQTFMDRNNRRIKPIPKIPKKNRWNRPFPKSRIKGIMQKWYARHADLLMPPLQESQWLKIYEIAMRGIAATHFKIPKRRPVGSVPVFTEPEGHEAEWFDKIDSLIRTSAQRPQYSRKIRASIGNPHHMTNRFLRRMTQQAVLESTATVIVNPTTGKSAFRREAGMKPTAKPMQCTESQQLSLFD